MSLAADAARLFNVHPANAMRGESDLQRVLREFNITFILDGAGPAAIALTLNSLMEKGLCASNGALGTRSRNEFELHRRRAAIVAALPAAFSGGPGVEFADGFHGVEEIAASGFLEGILTATQYPHVSHFCETWAAATFVDCLLL